LYRDADAGVHERNIAMPEPIGSPATLSPANGLTAREYAFRTLIVAALGMFLFVASTIAHAQDSVACTVTSRLPGA
jgi:hypothetical protein